MSTLVSRIRNDEVLREAGLLKNIPYFMERDIISIMLEKARISGEFCGWPFIIVGDSVWFSTTISDSALKWQTVTVNDLQKTNPVVAAGMLCADKIMFWKGASLARVNLEEIKADCLEQLIRLYLDISGEQTVNIQNGFLISQNYDEITPFQTIKVKNTPVPYLTPRKPIAQFIVLGDMVIYTTWDVLHEKEIFWTSKDSRPIYGLIYEDVVLVYDGVTKKPVDIDKISISAKSEIRKYFMSVTDALDFKMQNSSEYRRVVYEEVLEVSNIHGKSGKKVIIDNSQKPADRVELNYSGGFMLNGYITYFFDGLQNVREIDENKLKLVLSVIENEFKGKLIFKVDPASLTAVDVFRKLGYHQSEPTYDMMWKIVE